MGYLVILELIVNILINLGIMMILGAYQSLQSPYYSWYRFYDYPKLYECWWGFSNMPNVDELNPVIWTILLEDKNSVINKWLKLRCRRMEIRCSR